MCTKIRLLLPLLFLLAAPSTPAALVEGDFIPCAAPSSSSVYTVQPGDTLYAIARRHGLSCGLLLALNPDLSARHLPIGAKVALPAPSARRLTATTVSRGNSLRIYAWPLAGIITSPFGQRGNGIHHGIDIAGNTGDPVQAAAAGTVSKAARHDIYGNFILIDHLNGQQTLYAHLSRIDVQPGDRIFQGQTIGAVGTTGNSTGPHLHFEIRENQIAIDPLPYLPR